MRASLIAWLSALLFVAIGWLVADVARRAPWPRAISALATLVVLSILLLFVLPPPLALVRLDLLAVGDEGHAGFRILGPYLIVGVLATLLATFLAASERPQSGSLLPRAFATFLALTIVIGLDRCAMADHDKPTSSIAPSAATPRPSPPPQAPTVELPQASDGPDSATRETIYELQEGIEKPQKIRGENPDFSFLQGNHRRVTCIFKAVVSSAGHLEAIERLKPENLDAQVEKAILDALATWRFEPARREGKPIALRYYLTLGHCPVG